MVKKISLIAMFSAFAILVSYIETFIPSIGIPGVKLGLANIVIVLAIYILDVKYAIVIDIVRILLVGFMFGSLFSIYFALVGAFFSILIMAILKKVFDFSIVTISVFGGVFHNVGQIVVAAIVVSSYNIIYYLPVLLIAGIICGLIIGILARILLERTRIICEKLGV